MVATTMPPAVQAFILVSEDSSGDGRDGGGKDGSFVTKKRANGTVTVGHLCGREGEKFTLRRG